MQNAYPNKEAFIALATERMPFGKYKGLRLYENQT
jgi:uncharacterized protein (DUF3820 family)